MGDILEFPSQRAQGLAFLDREVRQLLEAKGADAALVEFAAAQLTGIYAQLSEAEQYHFSLHLPAGLTAGTGRRWSSSYTAVWRVSVGKITPSWSTWSHNWWSRKCASMNSRGVWRPTEGQMWCTWSISYSLLPLGALTTITSPSSLPTSARAIGELTEIRLRLTSASSSPTIR